MGAYVIVVRVDVAWNHPKASPNAPLLHVFPGGVRFAAKVFGLLNVIGVQVAPTGNWFAAPEFTQRSLGAWPVFGFFGLDVLLVYVAFRANYRAARAREEVSLSRTSLDIRKIAPSGKAEAHRFNPFWAKFAVSRHEEAGITQMAVEGQGKIVQIGGFLNPDDRETFATAFGAALATAKSR